MAEVFTAIIFLDRNGFLVYTNSQHKVFQFNFPTDVVRDLEVINSDLLNSQIAAFFKQTGLKPFQGAIFLSDNLLFEKQVQDLQDKEADELKIFLDNLPFERVGKIEYLGEKTLFVATNSDLYQLLITLQLS